MFTIVVKLLSFLKEVGGSVYVIGVWITQTLTADDLINEFLLCKQCYSGSILIASFVNYAKTLLFNVVSDVIYGIRSLSNS